MSVGDKWENRVREALALGALYPIIRAIVSSFRDIGPPETFEGPFHLILLELQLLPLIIDLGGLLFAVAIAGPIFGLIGFALEYWGVAVLFGSGNTAGIWALLIGAGMIVLGSMVWEWEYLSLLGGSSRGGR